MDKPTSCPVCGQDATPLNQLCGKHEEIFNRANEETQAMITKLLHELIHAQREALTITKGFIPSAGATRGGR